MKYEESVIKAWQNIEQLNPYIIKNDRLKPLRNIDTLPWSSSQERDVCYKLYLGVFLISELYSIICDHFQLDKEEKKRFAIEKEIENGNKQSCFATILIDSNGNYINNSLQTSIMPLALGKIDHPDKILPETYNESIELQLSNYIKYFKSFNSIVAFGDYLSKVTEFSPKMLDFLYWEKIKTGHEEKYKKRILDSTPGILNSFYLKDMKRVLNAIKNDNIGSALKKYLSNAIEEKVNVEKIEEIKKILTSDSIPHARWPNNPKHSLSLMQSVAVTKVLNMKEDVFSVNGPPGTGKTTLLKEVIANLIFKRAEILSEYENPKDIFEKVKEVSVNNFPFNIRKIDERLSSYSIVIASSNNGAVENITKDLPLYESVSEEFISEDEYFSRVSDGILGEKTWGLLSAAFGNNSNKNSFFDNLWFTKDDEVTRIQDYLNQESDVTWEEATKSFKEKRLAVEKEISRIKTIEKLLKRQSRLLKMIKIEEKKYNKLDQGFSDFKSKKQVLIKEYNQLTKERERIAMDKVQLYENRPWWIFSILNYKYRNRMTEMKRRMNDLIIEQQEIMDEIKEINIKIEKIRDEKNELYELLRIFKEEYADNKLETDEMREDAGKNFVDEDYWQKSYKQLQMSSPWLYEKLNCLRSELFIESLRLHKAMIMENSSVFRRDIIPGIINLLNNNLAIEDAHKYGDAIWNNFFLLVPVISSTFASFENMAKDLNRESIGWLLIDEAGQAVPQAAAGAIWRSRNVIAVGDPLQIRPVVSTPDFLFSKVRNYYDLDRLYLSKSSSVQLIMDKVNKYSGRINNQWVGSPLNVHRRCTDPMFSISNMIAYENKMICATLPPKDTDIKLGSSYWLDVKGRTTSKHYVEAQGEIVKEVLKLKYKENRNPDVYIISPFKDVVNKLKVSLRGLGYSSNWINNAIGTIHTFQGKEEKAVILCLGLDKKNEGAAQWASMVPNILNVAVSRAKYELIVIGDLDLWGSKSNFDVAKNQLNVLDEINIKEYLYETSS